MMAEGITSNFLRQRGVSAHSGAMACAARQADGRQADRWSRTNRVRKSSEPFPPPALRDLCLNVDVPGFAKKFSGKSVKSRA